MAQGHRGAHVGRHAKFVCYTGFREPTSRVLSCWDYRGLGDLAGKSTRDLPLERFRAVLEDGMSRYLC